MILEEEFEIEKLKQIVHEVVAKVRSDDLCAEINYNRIKKIRHIKQYCEFFLCDYN